MCGHRLRLASDVKVTERAMKKQARAAGLIRIAAVATLLVMQACAAGPRRDETYDRAITARVRALLEQYPSLQAPNHVTVQTVRRVVYLRGLVSTPYQQLLAGSVAAQADQGLHIVNLIAVDNIH